MLELLYKISGQHPATTMPFGELYSGLIERVNKGLIHRKVSGDLELFSYSRDCMFERLWDTFTLMARGLVLCPKEERVIGLSFVKFFNFSEISIKLPDCSFSTYEKIDGSLIICYFFDDMWHCITRGSFKSEQAVWATKWLHDNVNINSLHKGTTYLAEAIYPENRIVVSYDFSGLVLLSAYNEKGYELTRNQLELEAECIGFKIVDEKHHSIDEMIEIVKDLPISSEGFVVRFENGYRLKIKGEPYIRVHRLVSDCTPLAIWDIMMHCGDLEVIKKDLPEEFHKDYDVISNILQKKFEETLDLIKKYKDELEDFSVKDLGLLLKWGEFAKYPDITKTCMFSCRRDTFFEEVLEDPGNDFSHPRRVIFDSFRPTSNKLEGFKQSSAMNRFAEES